MDPWNCPPNPKSKEALTRVSHVTRAGVLHTTSLSQAPVLAAASGSRKGGWEAWGGWHLRGQLAVMSFWWLSPTIYESVSVSLFLRSPCFFRFHIEVKSINCALPYVDPPAKFWALIIFCCELMLPEGHHLPWVATRTSCGLFSHMSWALAPLTHHRSLAQALGCPSGFPPACGDLGRPAWADLGREESTVKRSSASGWLWLPVLLPSGLQFPRTPTHLRRPRGFWQSLS